MDSIPRNDAGALNWLQAFAATAQGDPRAAGLTGEEVATLATLTHEFEQAYMTASDPSTGTRPSIARKNAARSAAIEHARQVIKQIDANPSITDITRFALGLKPKSDRSAKPRHRPPATAPQLFFSHMLPDGTHFVHYCDSLRPEQKRKPEGVIALQLHAAIGDSAGLPAMGSIDPAMLPYVGNFTKTPMKLLFAPELRGKKALLYGRWVLRNGAGGPWSMPMDMVVAMGSDQPNVRVPVWGVFAADVKTLEQSASMDNAREMR